MPDKVEYGELEWSDDLEGKPKWVKEVIGVDPYNLIFLDKNKASDIVMGEARWEFKERGIKILIMVLSYDKSPYSELMQAQIDTWASVKEPNIRTFFYNGMNEIPEIKVPLGLKGGSGNWSSLDFPIRNDYFYMAGKFRSALEWVLKESEKELLKFDLIFRTNSSSYINKKELLKFAETLPKEKVYAGAEIKTNEGFSIVSGAGFFITPDTAAILRDEIDPEFEKEEDYYCGMILNKHGIEVINDESRYDVPAVIPADMPIDRYHYRFKNSNRLQDANNMRLIHQKIINK